MKNESACFVDCSSIFNTTAGNTKDGNCTCANDLVYLHNQKVCAIAVDCSKVPNSPGSNFNASTCDCDAGYKYSNWTIDNKTSGVCRRNCSLHPRTVKRNDTDYLSCVCKWGYLWDVNLAKCDLNCKDMPFSTGEEDDARCRCNNGYRWNADAGDCTKHFTLSTTARLAIGIPLGLLGS